MGLKARIDGTIQSAVDAVMFALMRATSWPRSLIRYRLTAWIAVAFQAIGCLAIRSLLTGIALLLTGCATLIWAARGDRTRDEVAERRGLGRQLRLDKIGALVVLGLCCIFIADHAIAWWAGREIVALFVAYAAATPPNPPAKARPVLAHEGGATG